MTNGLSLLRWMNTVKQCTHKTPFVLLLLLLLALATTVASAFRNNSIQIQNRSNGAIAENTKNRINQLDIFTMAESSSSHNDRCGIDYPELVVFDLDACFWDQEMYEMPALPSKTVTGPLNEAGEGVTGAYSGRNKISMHPGSMVALQEHSAGDKYPGMKVCFASSADTPFAEKIGRATLKLLEVIPGVTVWDLVLKDWGGQDVNQIGRQPPLSSNKAQTHFPRIRKLTGIPYNRMLFFDDCNWGDHVGMVGRGCKEDNGEGVVGHRTPRGLSVADWYKGLEVYKNARSS